MAFTATSTGNTNAGSVSATTLTMSCSAGALPVGTLVILGACANNSITMSVSDDSVQTGAANVYTAETVVTGTTFTGVIIWGILTRSMLTSNLFTVTYSISSSRLACAFMPFTPSNKNPVREGLTALSNQTTSPADVPSVGPVNPIDCLAVGAYHWKGAGVASGITGRGTIGAGTTIGISSGGTTTRVETNMFRVLNLASGAAVTGGAAYTSITTAAGNNILFSDNPIPHDSRRVRHAWAGN